MPRDCKVYLDDILLACRKIMDYTSGMSAKEFGKDEMVIDAVVRNLTIIGEAVKSIPEDWQQHYSHVDWPKINALRNILVHEYFGVNLTILWETVEQKIPQLLADVTAMLAELERNQ